MRAKSLIFIAHAGCHCRNLPLIPSWVATFPQGWGMAPAVTPSGLYIPKAQAKPCRVTGKPHHELRCLRITHMYPAAGVPFSVPPP